MCGIAGFVQTSPAPDVLAAMLARIRHRGPDGEGVFHARAPSGYAVALGHRRLSIIDVEGGAQPLSLADERAWITFNGEIYNYRELRAVLLARGRVFRTRSDTEVLLSLVASYADDRRRALRSLDGMFAFAIWDEARGELLLARDRVGIKPLYYAELPRGGLAFASELRALLAHPALGRDIDPAALTSYFFSDYAPAPESLVRGVKKLPPGTALLWRDGVVAAVEPFWSLAEIVPSRDVAPDRELARAVWARIDANVARQLVADVPIGVLLSGGIDSSSVAVLAARHVTSRLRTFSIGFESRAFDESSHARAVARHIGAEHVEEMLAERDLLDVVDQALGALDEPLADPSLLPTFLLARLAARHVKVVLGGDGGDELWGGYPTYIAQRVAPLYARLPRALRERLIPALVGAIPIAPGASGHQPLEWKLKRFAQRWDDDPTRRHLRWMSSTDLGDLADLLPASRATPHALATELPAWLDDVGRALALDFLTYLPGSVLAKVDRASMRHGLEVRPPLIANELIDLAFSLPTRVKQRGVRTKILLRAAAAPHLPGAIVARPKKGFGIPLADWVRGALRPAIDDAIRGAALRDAGVDATVLRRWLDEHVARSRDRSKPLYAALVFHRWAASL